MTRDARLLAFALRVLSDGAGHVSHWRVRADAITGLGQDLDAALAELVLARAARLAGRDLWVDLFALGELTARWCCRVCGVELAEAGDRPRVCRPCAQNERAERRWREIAIRMWVAGRSLLQISAATQQPILSLAGVGGGLRMRLRTGAQPGGDGAASEGIAQLLRRQGLMSEDEWRALLRQQQEGNQ